MGGQLRGGDVMARLGGDEFVLLLLETTTDRAAGVAQWSPGESIDALLARADSALYEAKTGDAGCRVAVATAVS